LPAGVTDGERGGDAEGRQQPEGPVAPPVVEAHTEGKCDEQGAPAEERCTAGGVVEGGKPVAEPGVGRGCREVELPGGGGAALSAMTPRSSST
jgi:hypothetical protein